MNGEDARLLSSPPWFLIILRVFAYSSTTPSVAVYCSREPSLACMQIYTKGVLPVFLVQRLTAGAILTRLPDATGSSMPSSVNTPVPLTTITSVH